MKNIIIFVIPGLARVISSATPLLALLIFSKLLSTEEIGLVSYFIAIITLLGILTDFGMSEGVQKFLSKTKSPKLVFTSLVLEFILCFIGAVIFLIIDLITGNTLSRGYPWLLFFIIIFSASNVVLLIFNGLAKNVRLTTYFLTSSLAFLFITFLLYFTGTSDAVTSFLLGRLISWIIFTIVPILDLYFNKLIEFKIELPKGFLKFIFNNMIVDISYSLFNQWDAILIINTLGSFQNGIYKSVAFIASLPYSLSVVLQTKLLPEYSALIHRGEYEKVKLSFHKFNKLLVILVLLSIIVGIVFSKFALSVFYTDEISNLGFQYFTPILLAVMLFVSAVPSICVLLAIHKEHIVRNMSIFQAVSFVLISSALIYPVGLVALPISLIFLNSIFLFVNFWFARKYLNKSINVSHN